MLWLWLPVLDGRSEIYYPGSTRFDIFFWDMFGPFLGLVPFGFHVICFSVAFVRRRSIWYLVLMLAPIGLLVSLHSALYPAGVTRAGTRVASFELGARAAVKRAGGGTKLRQDALALLEASSETSPAESEWPDSFRRLYPWFVTVDRKVRQVNIGIHRRPCWGDQFGYLLMDGEPNEPIVVEGHRVGRDLRLWLITDRAYLYEAWP